MYSTTMMSILKTASPGQKRTHPYTVHRTSKSRGTVSAADNAPVSEPEPKESKPLIEKEAQIPELTSYRIMVLSW